MTTRNTLTVLVAAATFLVAGVVASAATGRAPAPAALSYHAESAPEGEAAAWQALKSGGCVIVMRHALKEAGEGELPNFSIDDRSTQRNLTKEGVEQAKSVGARFKEHQVSVESVLSSPYFRCRETAEAAFGSMKVSPTLLALAADADLARRQTEATRKLVTEWTGKSNLALVTHTTNIKALTGQEVPMAACLVLKPKAGGFDVVGVLLPPPATR